MKKYLEIFIATTDTVVGIGAPVSRKNKKSIYKIKKRKDDKKLVIMVSSLEQARKFKDWNEKAEEMAKKYWPGATTLVVSKKLALRMPKNKKLLKLIDKLGPIYMTSANITQQKPLDFESAKKMFKMIKKHYYFGIGTNIPSKIINVKTKEVLRDD